MPFSIKKITDTLNRKSAPKKKTKGQPQPETDESDQEGPAAYVHHQGHVSRGGAHSGQRSRGHSVDARISHKVAPLSLSRSIDNDLRRYSVGPVSISGPVPISGLDSQRVVYASIGHPVPGE